MSQVASTRASPRAWTVLEDIDAPAVSARPVPSSTRPPTPPARSGPTEHDIAVAHAEGVRHGLRAAETGIAERAARALEAIAVAIRTETETAEAVAECCMLALADVVLRALAAAFPSLEATYGPEDAASLVRVVMPGLSREPRVVIRVAADAADAVAAALAGLPTDLRERVELGTDPLLAEHDARLSWRDGGVARDPMAVRADVLSALDLIMARRAAPERSGETG